ncbi:hypothetical protein E1B28_000854 [Marasmius oreades]|uniref:Uncharacterized protein n=1 Tax=Marasmius oreades TaxID=181124 RepID=A0A9P8AEK7_9AGAR|nr:uncharacterized protein E1B28_000854 [Marasmius oreades]KAG7098966.1 hypothetical protein E1B28_000854 [Marasmius oreades]
MSTSTTSMDSSVAAEIEKFRTDVAKNAEDIIFKTFPAKILELNKRIATFSSNDSSTPFHPSHAKAHTDVNVYPPLCENGGNGPPSKKRKTTDSTSDQGESSDFQNGALYTPLVKANQHTRTLHESVKKECEQLAGLIDQVKLWVTLTMPRIEE